MSINIFSKYTRTCSTETNDRKEILLKILTSTLLGNNICKNIYDSVGTKFILKMKDFKVMVNHTYIISNIMKYISKIYSLMNMVIIIS